MDIPSVGLYRKQFLYTHSHSSRHLSPLCDFGENAFSVISLVCPDRIRIPMLYMASTER